MPQIRPGRYPAPLALRLLASAALTLALVSPRAVQASRAPESGDTAPAGAEMTGEPDPTPPTDAPDPGADTKAKAMDAFRRGQTAYKAGKYEEALAAFQEASSLFASPDFQYNIGRCYENLERYADAVRSYEIYLRAKEDAADSGDVRERIGRLRGLIEARKAEEAAANDEADPQSAIPTPAQPVDAAPKPPGRPLIITGAVLIGVGAALGIGGGVGFGVVAKARSDEIDEIQTGRNPAGRTLSDAEDIEQRGRNAEIGQIATAAIGGLIAIGGVVALSYGMLKKNKAKGATALVPSVGPRSAGLVLTGRF